MSYACATCGGVLGTRVHTESDCVEALLAERGRLRRQVAELTELAMRGVQVSDQMKLDLIMRGALRRP